MSYKRGDVVLVYFPNTDHITYRKRPALIIQADEIRTGLPQKIVAAITSNTSRTGETRVLIYKDSSLGVAMGVQTDSVIVTDNLETAFEREFERVIGHCHDMTEVDDALRKTLGL
jgi:mRNA interferase MazF